MNNTTKFETFDFIQYMSLDVIGELDNLEEMIDKCDGREIRHQYNHINSLLKGIAYTLDYIIDHDIDGNPYPISEQVAKIGNSVVPIMAMLIAKANLESK